MYKEKIFDAQTGEEIWRDFSDEEIAEVEAAKVAAAERVKLAAEKELAKQAVLDKLGLTAEEAAVLLG